MEDPLTNTEKLKEEGNSFLKANEFQKAVQSYTKAIEAATSPDSRIPPNKVAIYYANRAFAHIKLQNYGLAIPDAQESIKANPSYQKGYLRLGFAREVLQGYKQAYQAYLKAFELTGKKDQVIYQKLADCKRQSQELIRNKRLLMLHDEKERGPKTQKPYKDWREIEVQPDYQGPKLEEKQPVTAQWVAALMNHFKDQKKLHKRYTLQLIEDCRDRLRSLTSLVDYHLEDEEEITVCGDIHGQFYDLFNLFGLNGHPGPKNRYLFNGDFVDRGSFSVQCMLTLIAWKVAGIDWLHLTRGNHEAKQVNHIYGFKGEVQAKYSDPGVYEAFSELFCALPLAYVINKQVLICHGGLPSYDGVTLKDIRDTFRFLEPPEKGLMCDLLWADPSPAPGHTPSKRGASMGFGPDVTARFLKENGLSLLIRSHEVKQEGYEQTHDKKCVTIFSAPNYCDFTGNKAAFIKLRGDTMVPRYTQFEAVPHPAVGPMAYASNFRGMF